MAGAGRRQDGAAEGVAALGQDTAEVLESWLGIDAGEFANLKTDGVL